MSLEKSPARRSPCHRRGSCFPSQRQHSLALRKRQRLTLQELNHGRRLIGRYGFLNSGASPDEHKRTVLFGNVEEAKNLGSTFRLSKIPCRPTDAPGRKFRKWITTLEAELVPLRATPVRAHS